MTFEYDPFWEAKTHFELQEVSRVGEGMCVTSGHDPLPCGVAVGFSCLGFPVEEDVKEDVKEMREAEAEMSGRSDPSDRSWTSSSAL